jgi:DNA-binding CsgD family transcriptional regulator
MTLPYVVVEAGDQALADARGELTSLGWQVVDRLADGPREGGLVYAVPVTGEDDAAVALFTAIEGVGLLVDAAGAPRPVVDRLCDDLRRLGHLDHRVSVSEPLLTAEERALMDLLADGRTLGAAADALHLSRRSADRRLAAARAKLGADATGQAGTGQAIAAYRRRLERLPRPA